MHAKRPFTGPEVLLTYLSRYPHRVAISNSRLVSLDAGSVSFRRKDYRAKGRTRHKTMERNAYGVPARRAVLKPIAPRPA